ncbi:MAG: putative non-heme bromoperoxidase BpoC [Promethearchaeota archaeon]|nr:MAG: putative non-heme bromoperoxidase BpoC [Candidatus Lokiarchaeota archaeon]
MAEDYADLIRKTFNFPVNIMGTSTGGQIAQYLAADHPDVVKKLILISTAYRLSEEGAKIEKKAADYFKQAKYGKSMTAITDMVYSTRFLKAIVNPLILLFGRKFIGDVEYPNDFLNEIQGDREMNFINRLKDIKASTLVLSGAQDIGYTAEDVKKTAEGIPNAQLKLYENYGHNLFMRNRKEVIIDMLDFLSG